MVHLRIVAPVDRSERVVDLLERSASTCNLVLLPGAARKPAGDVILCDVAREDASVIVDDLRELEIPRDGSIAIEQIDSQLSAGAERAIRAARGAASDAVVWEEVEARTSESTELGGHFLTFMVLACLIASIGIYLDSPILIIGGMVVGPEFGPIAGLCVAIVHRRVDEARRSLIALAVGFPLAILAAYLFTLFAQASGLLDADIESSRHALSDFISHPDAFSFIVAALAGAAGVLSLTSAKSGALIGVLISVTTILAAANIGIAAALGDWSDWRGSIAQLAVNLVAIVLAGVGTLYVQRLLYKRRLRRHHSEGSPFAIAAPTDPPKSS
ncbi:MAG TPA: DUF389 domain-containing protein [Solirubrobacterales bacterium]|nr:DUF389 domain-containing protein [Solirubrobacterales bacterium]